MKFFLILPMLFILFSCSSLPKKRTDKLSILQGVTNTKEVEFSVLAPKGKILRFEIRTAEGEVTAPDEVKVVTRDFSPYALHKMVFVRDPKKDHNLYVYEADKIIDQRLIGRGQKMESELRIAVASCMDDFFPDHFKIWDALARQNPEYLLLLGDNVYADLDESGKHVKTDPEHIWNRYVDVRLTLPLYFQEKLIPTHAVWDDNDYGLNNGGEDFEFKDQSRQIFEAFFAQDMSDDDWTKGFGVGGLLTLGDFNLYFLDARSFRSTELDGPHLGNDQREWLIKKLTEETTPSFIIKGDQFFGGYHQFDSYEGKHAKDFTLFVEELRHTKAPFIFLSGDRHMSEIMQFPRGLFGMPSFEITSSPMHGKLYGSTPTAQNPWQVVAQRDHVNFTMIQNSARDNHWFLDVENIGENGEVYYRRELAVFIKDLQNNLNEVKKKRRHIRRRHHRVRRRR